MKINIVPLIIILTFVAFAIFILSMVFRSFQSPVDLVSKDYYAQEIKYQTQIEKIKRSEDFQKKIQFFPTKNTLKIQFPDSLEYTKLKGKAHFFRPSNLELDFSVPFQLENQNLILDKLETLQKGAWIIRLDFEYAGTEYFVEERLEF